MNEDLYAVLGVLPEAEEIVIKAAYRALAQRYHPDRWDGDASVANAMMTRLNHAYSILSDKVAREKYDQQRSGRSQGRFSDEPQDERAFDDAQADQQDRWDVACSIYPDLEQHRTHLGLISRALAFAFVTIVLEKRAFSQRQAISKHMERAFLQRYFGTNDLIVDFARDLILEGARNAARRLNTLVDVLGSDVDADLLINKIQSEFPSTSSAKARRQREEAIRALGPLMQSVRKSGHYLDAIALAKSLGYSVTEKGGDFMSEAKVEARHPDGPLIEFPSKWVFIAWVQKNLCDVPCRP